MIPMYVTEAEVNAVEGFDGDAKEWAAKASRMVRHATMNDDTSPLDELTGLPTRADILAAMHDAAMVQIKWWAANGVDPIGGIGQLSLFNVAKSSIGSASVEGNADLAAAQDRARGRSLNRLVPDAVMIIRDAGLGRAIVRGGS